MKTLIFLVCMTIFVCGVHSNSGDKDLIIDDVNARSTASPPEDNTDKFNDVVDEASLDGKIGELRMAFELVQGNIKTVKDQQHDSLDKDQLEALVEMLTNARDGFVDGTGQNVLGIKELKTCIVLLGAKATSLEGVIPRNNLKMLTKDIKTLEAEIHAELDHLLKLIHSMDCNLKRTAFNELHATSQSTLHDKIQHVGNINDMCSEFNTDCAEAFKEAKMGFTDFMDNNIEELKKQLKEIIHLECLAHPSQQKVLENKIDALEQHALQWIRQLTESLKHLVEFEIDTLSASFKQTCDDVNEQRLLFKDNKGIADETTQLAIITAALTTLSSDASTITTRFLTAYDVLLHLKGIVDDKEFNACYDKASELYYLVQGFKLQIEELLATVNKRDIIVAFEKKIEEFIGARTIPDDPNTASEFTKSKQDFLEHLKDLKEVGIADMCASAGGATVAKEFEAIFMSDDDEFARHMTAIDTIRTDELPKLLNCPEYAEKSAQVTLLRNEVIKYKKNSEQQKCFGNTFDMKFC